MPAMQSYDFMCGVAMTLAELSRLDGANLARRVADQWELSLPDFVGARIDESDLEELRRVFAGPECGPQARLIDEPYIDERSGPD
jgi:protein gp37